MGVVHFGLFTKDIDWSPDTYYTGPTVCDTKEKVYQWVSVARYENMKNSPYMCPDCLDEDKVSMFALAHYSEVHYRQ